MIINKQKKEMVSKHNFESVAIKKKNNNLSVVQIKSFLN